MAAELVTVILDRFDGGEKPYVKGTASWAPSLEFPDIADQMLVGQAPVTARFRAGSLPVVAVIANDTAGPQQAGGLPGWTWNVTWSADTPGAPGPASYYVLSANGATQRLSQLAQVPVAQPGQQYLPLTGGPAPQQGQVPVFTGVGYATAAAPNGSGADKNYALAFGVSSTVAVAHGLAKYPSVTVLDSAGDEVECDVVYADPNHLTLTFSAPFSGTVTCN